MKVKGGKTHTHQANKREKHMYPAELDKWRRRPIVGQGDGGMERVSRRRSQPSEKLTDEVRQHHRERGKEPEEQHTEKKRL